MHIFLTGALQIGKSTIIRRVIKHAQKPIGGFQTYFSGSRNDPERKLYLADISAPSIASDRLVVARFSGGVPHPDAARFNALGCPLVRNAVPDTALLIMDECGRLERDALAFQAAILRALDGSLPILGVVREDAKGWVESIRAHPKVDIITVTTANRDTLPALLTTRLFPQYSAPKRP